MKSGSVIGKLLIVIFIIAIFAVGAFIVKTLILDPYSEEISDKVMTEAVTSSLSDEDAAKVEEALSNMSEEDRGTVKKIIAENVDAADVPGLVSSYKNGETEELIAYANEHLDDDERDTLIQIYLKYARQNG